jgi:hypothetical protein
MHGDRTRLFTYADRQRDVDSLVPALSVLNHQQHEPDDHRPDEQSTQKI